MRNSGKRRMIGIVVMAIVLCVYLSGCALGSRGRSSNVASGQNLNVAIDSRFEDLPVPNGFALLRKTSFIFQNNQTRMGTLRYKGYANLGTLIEFYKKNMVYNGWNFINIVEFGRVILNFENGEESCIVTLEQKGLKNMIVSLNLSPRSSQGIPVPKEPDPVDEQTYDEEIIIE